jgi:hypothetical protein
VKAREFTLLVALSVVAGFLGYVLRGRQWETTVALSASQVPPVDYYFTPPSFSEAKNARALVEALAARFLNEVQIKRMTQLRAVAANRRGGPSAPEPHLNAAIEMLEEGVEEFQGTHQELRVVQALLLALKKDRQYGRWIEVYLETLYQHPTHELVGRVAKEALMIGEASGRKDEVVEGFLHLNAIPFEFDGKRQVQTALVKAGFEDGPSWSAAR